MKLFLHSSRLRDANLAVAMALVLSMTASACTSGSSPSTTPEEPIVCPGCNVVLISLDTVRADHLGLYGYQRPTSPNLDRFASTAVVFERAVGQTAWTLPAHASMFSGLYPGELGLDTYPATRRIPRSAKMLAEVFHEHGYLTAGFTGGGFVAGSWGFARGFDIYTTGGRRFEHNLGQALGWLTANKTRRFFLFLHGYDAHRPYYSEPHDKKAVRLPAALPDQLDGYCPDNASRPNAKRLARILSYYDAAIHHADTSLARLFSALDQASLRNDTIVLVTADHGEEFFEHGHCDHVRFLYDETIHVPLLVRIPGVQAHRVKVLVPATVTVANTLLELVGIAPPRPSLSLVDRLHGDPAPFAAVYSQTGSTLGIRGSRGYTTALSTPRFELISYPETAALEAFDRRNDPAQQRPLPSNHPFYRRQGQLDAWRKSLAVLAAEPLHADDRQGGGKKTDDENQPPLPDPAVHRHLRSLGYLH